MHLAIGEWVTEKVSRGMSTKPFWIVAGSAELIAVVVLVLSEWDMISDDNLTVKILALLLGPAIVCLYHITFIAPYTSYLRSQNVMQGIYIEDLLRMREEHRWDCLTN